MIAREQTASQRVAFGRIAFDARYISDRHHGIGRYAFHLLEALVSAAPGYTFIVFRGKGQDTRFDWDTLAERPNVVFRPGPWPLYWPHEQLAWPIVLRQARADLFHSPYFVAPLPVSIPTIITIHDLIFDRYPAYMPQKWTRPYYKLLMTLGTHQTRRVITTSQATAADLTHYYRVPQQKIAVIAEGVGPNFHPVLDADRLQSLRQQYGLPRPFVMAVGTRRPHKNLTRLVQAFASVNRDLLYDVVFVGPPDPRFPDVARRVANQVLPSDHVHFLDWVIEADLPGLYSLADLVVMPSLIEGFGLPVLEAMTCGTPVLAANGSSLSEVLGDAGMLFDPYDVDDLANAMYILLHDPLLRSRLSQAGLRRAALFNWTQIARQVLQLYERVQVTLPEPCEGCPEAA